VKTKYLFAKLLVGSALSIALVDSAYAAQNTVPLACQIELDSPFNRLTLRGRVSDDKIINTQINLPISANAEENHIVLEDEAINSFFHHRIVFLGNAHLDPVTGSRKLFIGMYEAYSNNLRGRTHMFKLPFLDYFTDYRGETVLGDSFGLPIVSAASDSGRLDLFTGDYKQSRLKMKCEIKDNVSVVTQLNFDQPRHQFTCNINMKNGHSGRKIDEINKQVTLGFNVNDRQELQPIIEDEHLSSVLASAKIMGNLYLNPETSKPELLLGIYRMSRWYDPVRHEGYYTPEYQPRSSTEAGKKFFYAMPLAEVRTNSDYAELRTGATASGYSLKVECKKINNQMAWIEQPLN
jgi:hypothetical protein